jgi:hypothetical protein
MYYRENSGTWSTTSKAFCESRKAIYSGKFSSLASIIDSLITNAERSIDVPLVKPNLTPVYKKGRDATVFSNYRGITVSCTIGKILEHVILNRIEHLLPSQQSSLQFGFTKGTSILLSALVINESIIEAKELNLPLYIAFPKEV